MFKNLWNSPLIDSNLIDSFNRYVIEHKLKARYTSTKRLHRAIQKMLPPYMKNINIILIGPILRIL